MKTEYIKVSPEKPDEASLMRAAECIKRGGLVVFPTETVYGLGANTFDTKAVKNIYKAKGRPSDNPLIAHIAEPSWAELLAREISDDAFRLMEAFWGGPLTMIFKKRYDLPPEVTAGLDTIAVRLPSHSVANALIRLAGVPVSAPSANLSGSPSPTAFAHAAADMDGRVDIIIDGGSSSIGVESTVVDMTGKKPVILRPGAVTADDIKNVCGSCSYGGEYADAPKCPGMKYTHYSPKAEVFAVRDMEKLRDTKENSAAIVYDYTEPSFSAAHFYSAGKNDEEYAARLFYLLRKADEDKADVLYAPLPEDRGIGTAIRNRLLKAAGGRVI